MGRWGRRHGRLRGCKGEVETGYAVLSLLDPLAKPLIEDSTTQSTSELSNIQDTEVQQIQHILAE